MIRKVKENLRILVGLQDLGSDRGIALENTEYGQPICLSAFVVNLAAGVNINSGISLLCGLVKKFTLVRIGP